MTPTSFGFQVNRSGRRIAPCNWPFRYRELDAGDPSVALTFRQVKQTCVQASRRNGGDSTVTRGRSATGTSLNLVSFGFQVSKSGKTPNRKSRGNSLSKSIKNAPSFQARSVIWIGSQKPGSRSRSGSNFSHTETVPDQ